MNKTCPKCGSISVSVYTNGNIGFECGSIENAMGSFEQNDLCVSRQRRRGQTYYCPPFEHPVFTPNPATQNWKELFLKQADISFQLQAENQRLKAGNFTPEELQNLCHNLKDTDHTAFCDGCDDYQRKLFGKSRGDHLCHTIKKLEVELREARDKTELLKNALAVKEITYDPTCPHHTCVERVSFGCPVCAQQKCDTLTKLNWDVTRIASEQASKIHEIEEKMKNYSEIIDLSLDYIACIEKLLPPHVLETP